MEYFYVNKEKVKGLSLDEKKDLMNTYDNNIIKLQIEYNSLKKDMEKTKNIIENAEIKSKLLREKGSKNYLEVNFWCDNLKRRMKEFEDMEIYITECIKDVNKCKDELKILIQEE